ncbi:MAG: hypothetical protein JWN21_1838, partial [Sphingomonas bacterium]|nr:hypothetical protein [Sphingomonas bacterium]
MVKHYRDAQALDVTMARDGLPW